MENKKFVYENDKLMSEWNWEKNIKLGLDPHKLFGSSAKKVWWKCANGHEWEASINNRKKGKGCPYCSGQKVFVGFNDLATVNPILAAEWHPTKNGLTPYAITAHSSKKVWWRCKQGHEWQATVNNRNNGNGCPVCFGRKIIVGFNDLATVNPTLAAEWHPTKNVDLTPYAITAHSGKKVWWRCRQGHEWEAAVNDRSNGNGCPKCFGELKTSFPEQAIFFYCKKVATAYNRYRVNSRTEIDIFLSDYNLGIEYDGVFYHKGKEAQQREKRKQDVLDRLGIVLIRVKETDGSCDNIQQPNVIYLKTNPKDKDLNNLIQKLFNYINKIYKIHLKADIDVTRDRFEIYDQYIKGEKEKSLLAINPQLAKEWHSSKNKSILPEHVSVSSNKKVWWKCSKCGYEWEATINHRNAGRGCPCCAGQKILIGYNDLATVNPVLAKEWHPTKNGQLTPQDVTAGSNKKVWWKCKQGHEWATSINNRRRGEGCPYCAIKKKAISRKNNKTPT